MQSSIATQVDAKAASFADPDRSDQSRTCKSLSGGHRESVPTLYHARFSNSPSRPFTSAHSAATIEKRTESRAM
jgi:hypothetical protein